ncbi:glycosyl transferase family 1 [[Phormidium ambiguum] IAM M-71]|uniref:Glycosyl transferase family 1 n=1 Tax=[Phormidium ambiguum] IAM M-71 TaxID=454136 RepID=A0A1U7ISD4_9CYAN|nr:glycosyltransferase family 4 protein [Phormidium ambiguum]OKH40421.1 glycosyl transferase family 1 [Phormidium ambiguum IAM M-71]
MPNFRISLVHPTGNPFARNAAIAFSEANLLHEIITSIAYNPQKTTLPYLNLLPKSFKNKIISELGRRTWIPPKNTTICTYPVKEVVRIAITKTNINRSLGFSSQSLVDWVYASLDRQVAKHHLHEIQAIYAYEDGAAETFQVAKQHNIFCLYDLPILFYRTSREIQESEALLYPELATSLQAAKEPAWKIERKEQEIQLADRIFVPSSFVQKSLVDAGIKAEKISVIPFGAPIEYFSPKPKQDDIFRALFIGRVGPRKGAHYLLQAWQELKLVSAELLLVGMNEFPENYLEKYTDIIRYIPSVPHSSLNTYYNSGNVLVLPTLVEGLPLVILEAMACGIPVITTPNAGISDIITNGVEGFIVPIRDPEALKEKLEWCYHHPQELAEMGLAARRKAESLTWNLYRQKLINQVQQVFSDDRK